MRIGYQDIVALASLYKVSTDYLFGLTDNRQYRNIDVDRLRLSDNAIIVLESGKINNRLLSELIAHTDFSQLSSAIEMYIDRKLLPQLETMNAVYKLTEQTILKNCATQKNDEILEYLQQSVVNEDEYLRFRLSERFNELLKSLFETHKKDPLPSEQAEIINDMKECAQIYLERNDSPSPMSLS